MTQRKQQQQQVAAHAFNPRQKPKPHATTPLSLQSQSFILLFYHKIRLHLSFSQNLPPAAKFFSFSVYMIQQHFELGCAPIGIDYNFQLTTSNRLVIIYILKLTYLQVEERLLNSTLIEPARHWHKRKGSVAEMIFPAGEIVGRGLNKYSTVIQMYGGLS